MQHSAIAMSWLRASSAASAFYEKSRMKPKAFNKASGLFVAVALMATLGAPAHLLAYADDSASAAGEAQTSNQATSGESAAQSGQNDKEEPEKEGKSSVVDAVRTASEASGALGNDAQGIPMTSAIALGLAAVALLAVAFKLKA